MNQPIKMCEYCKDEKCKEKGYSKVRFCKDAFYWSIFGIGAGASFIILAAVYIIIRIVDSNWAQWELPTIMGIVWLTLVSVGAMLFSLKTIKQETVGKDKKEKIKEEPNKKK